MKRRSFLGLIAGGTVTAYLNVTRAATGADEAGTAFRHGVASGDPLGDRVILWTRVSGHSRSRVRVRWQVAKDPDFREVVARGRVRTGPERDYTVKVDADGLEPGTAYFYRFRAGGETSTTGRTQTLPDGRLDAARFAVVSCSNHPYGYFHVYRDIAEDEEIDAVIHLGDYIYEYGMGGYATEYAEVLGRIPEPPVEVVTLADYRQRYAQYKADPDSQAMRARMPLIAVWDDHEITNDAWRDGAQNHQDDEGSYAGRVAAATQAYFEWMPIRGEARSAESRIFRSFRYGDLLSLIMLDTRLYGRDSQPDANGESDPERIGRRLNDASRRMLGAEQEAWFERELEQSSAVWQVIGQQIMVSPVRTPDLEPIIDMEADAGLPRDMRKRLVEVSKSNPPMLLDTWNGYPHARQDFLAAIARHSNNAVVVTGDLHTSMAGDLIPEGGDAPVAVEMITTSVTSPGFDQYLPQQRPGAIRDATLDFNATLRYMETSRRGWLKLNVTRDDVIGEWHLVDGVQALEYTKSVDRRLRVATGEVGKGLQDA